MDERPVEITLKFYSPDHDSRISWALKGGDYFSALWDIYNRVRAYSKHGGNAEEVLDAIMEMVIDSGILDEA